ncbi:MAG: hypothetical protein MK105_15385 [Crocinitomicaceae bacterium]|nr:hypothetical protein [Crocinitomicaceae bacterium]
MRWKVNISASLRYIKPKNNRAKATIIVANLGIVIEIGSEPLEGMTFLVPTNLQITNIYGGLTILRRLGIV